MELGDASEQDEWLTMGPLPLAVAMVELVSDFGPGGGGGGEVLQGFQMGIVL
jgi:hypothetical protein